MSVATILLTLLMAAPGAVPSIATRLEHPSKLTVGDRFELAFDLTVPSRSLVTGPLADTMGVFMVAGENRKTTSRGDHDETTYKLSMAGFEPGTHALPVFTFLVESGSRTDTLHTEPDSVTIASVLPAKMSDVNGLKPAEEFPNRWLWLIPVIVLLAAALAYAALRIYRRVRRIREEARAPLPPWEEALGALDALPWRDWLQGGEVQRYYYALSEVLKRYIERRFAFQAAEQTTTEMLASMRIHRVPMRDEIRDFFSRSDLVKYAKLAPPADEALTAIDRVRAFVVRTRPEEPPPAAAGDAKTAGPGVPAAARAGGA